jgi:hypothetical protein
VTTEEGDWDTCLPDPKTPEDIEDEIDLGRLLEGCTFDFEDKSGVEKALTRVCGFIEAGVPLQRAVRWVEAGKKPSRVLGRKPQKASQKAEIQVKQKVKIKA